MSRRKNPGIRNVGRWFALTNGHRARVEMKTLSGSNVQKSRPVS